MPRLGPPWGPVKHVCSTSLNGGKSATCLRLRLAQTHLCHFAEARGTEGREVHRRAQRQQALVCADVARRLFAADVLLARLECQHPAALAVAVPRLADEPARKLPNEFLRKLLDVGELRDREMPLFEGTGIFRPGHRFAPKDLWISS